MRGRVERQGAVELGRAREKPGRENGEETS